MNTYTGHKYARIAPGEASSDRVPSSREVYIINGAIDHWSILCQHHHEVPLK